MFADPIHLTAVEYWDRFLTGSTKPLLIGALDRNGQVRKVVLKLRLPEAEYGFGHYGGTSLACELICSVLARFLGLLVPDYAIVEVTPEFASSVTDENVSKLLAANLGANFGTVFHPSLAQWQNGKRIRSETILDQLEHVLTFDATVINYDRKHGRPNLLFRGDELYLIDHSLALMVCIVNPGLSEEHDLFPDGEVYEHCASRHLTGKDLGYCHIRDRFNGDCASRLISFIRSVIPSSWEGHPGQLEKLSSFLVNRSLQCHETRMNLIRLLK